MYLCANCRTVTTVGKEIGEKNSNDALINCIDVTVTTVTQTTMTHPISKIDVCASLCVFTENGLQSNDYDQRPKWTKWKENRESK